jgi:hypothetical protein
MRFSLMSKEYAVIGGFGQGMAVKPAELHQICSPLTDWKKIEHSKPVFTEVMIGRLLFMQTCESQQSRIQKRK